MSEVNHAASGQLCSCTLGCEQAVGDYSPQCSVPPGLVTQCLKGLSPALKLGIPLWSANTCVVAIPVIARTKATPNIIAINLLCIIKRQQSR